GPLGNRRTTSPGSGEVVHDEGLLTIVNFWWNYHHGLDARLRLGYSRAWDPGPTGAARTSEKTVMDLSRLFKGSKHAKDYRAGTTIFAQGEPRDVMYVVLAGEVDLQRGGQTFRTPSPGTLGGEMAVIDRAPRSATAPAETDRTAGADHGRRVRY